MTLELSRPLLVSVLAEATQLAASDEQNEPAALFYACARRPRVFGKAAQFVIPFLTQAQARAVGLERHVDPDAVELILLRLRVLRGEITFEELRDWFAARMRAFR